MEQAASALAQAVGGVDAEVEAELVNSEEARDRIVVVSAESENKSWGVAGRGAERESRSGVTIDALVGVLQDPDRGVPRALETRLKDVKIRRGELCQAVLAFTAQLLLQMLGLSSLGQALCSGCWAMWRELRMRETQ